MRVPQLGCEVEFEILVIFNYRVTDFEGHRVTLANNLLLEEWFDSWVHFFLDVFHDHWCTHSDGRFEQFEIVSVSKLHNPNMSLFFHVFDPLIGLYLRIYEKWPSSRFVIDNSILDTKGIVWQSE